MPYYEPSWSDLVYLGRRLGMLPSHLASLSTEALWQLEDDARTLDAAIERVEVADDRRRRDVTRGVLSSDPNGPPPMPVRPRRICTATDWTDPACICTESPPRND